MKVNVIHNLLLTSNNSRDNNNKVDIIPCVVSEITIDDIFLRKQRFESERDPSVEETFKYLSC